MAEQSIRTTIHDVLNLPSGRRVSVRWSAGADVARAATLPEGAGRDIDGSDLWLLPALYDADAHMPHVPFGVRHGDLHRALAGGVLQMNVAVPWHLARQRLDAVIAESTRSAVPKIVPLLSVSPVAESADFAPWFSAHGAALDARFPRLCKLYSNDPNFERNLDAVWAAGWKPMVWCAGADALAKLVARAADQPLHLRHAISAALVATMRRAKRATLQTCAHFLLPLPAGKRETLVVLPQPPTDHERTSLAQVFLDRVDVIASDHNGPSYVGAPPGPGLQTQQHFLAALLSLHALFEWPLERLWAKVTAAPAAVFGVPPPEGFVLVDPAHTEVVRPWPNQTPDRAPFEGMTFRGRVLAVASADRVELV